MRATPTTQIQLISNKCMDIYIFDMYNDLKEQENMRATPITRIQLFSNKYMDMHIFDMYNDLTEQEKI